jgi:hypothetical protein
VVGKKIKVAKLLVAIPCIDHAIGVDKVLGHGKCGYPSNPRGNCCIAIRAIIICQNGSFVATTAKYGLGGTTKFC